MLKFRNISGSSADPVAQWGTEGMLAVLERGGLDDWQKLYKAVTPAGEGNERVREQLRQAISMTRGGYLGEAMGELFQDML